MNLTILQKEDMQQVASMNEIIEADKLALKLYSEGKAQVPLRANLDVKEQEGQALFMPGYAGEARALGVKIVSVYPKNIDKGLPSVPATMVLLDSETGMVNGLMDGTYLTQLRTGAVSGAATDLLARKDAKTFVLIGTGGQASSQLEAVLAVRPIETVYVCDINAERAQQFAEQMQEELSSYSFQIHACTDANAVIPEADIITTVTTSKKPVFDGTLVKKGCHINSVGSYTPDMQETPVSLVQKADLIFVDTIDGVLNESGDVLTPIQEGLMPREAFEHELGNLVAGKETGRTDDEQITWFKTTGSAVLDVVAAQQIFERAQEKGIGVNMEC